MRIAPIVPGGKVYFCGLSPADFPQDRFVAGDLSLLFSAGICKVFGQAENEFGPEKLAAALEHRSEQPLDALLDDIPRPKVSTTMSVSLRWKPCPSSAAQCTAAAGLAA